MINKTAAYAYCIEDISKIENYEQAVNDDTLTWYCHHRKGIIFSKKDLEAINEYYHRPAIELIFLPLAEHTKLHNSTRHISDETKTKISAAHKGMHHTEETKQKMSMTHKGMHHTKETCLRISKLKRGNTNVRGYHWWNNGIKNIRAKECPVGYTAGRL